jgi:hypothetical protein
MTTTFYRHWRGLPERTWRRRKFLAVEIACLGTGELLANGPGSSVLRSYIHRLNSYPVRQASMMALKPSGD